jgi:hypothetical protein
MYAGGLSYFSSGSVRGNLRVGVWLEATATTDIRTSQVKKLTFDTLKHLKLKKKVATPHYLITEKRGETSSFPDMAPMFWPYRRKGSNPVRIAAAPI